MNELDYQQPCGCVLTINTETNCWHQEWCDKHNGPRSLEVVGRQVILLSIAKKAHRLHCGRLDTRPHFKPYTAFRKDALMPSKESRDWTR